MDNSSDTPQAQTKQSPTPCPRCPHRLSDLHTHESQPSSPTSEEPQKEVSNNDSDNPSCTAVDSQADEDFASRPPPEYPETTAEQSHPPEYETDYQCPTMLGEDCVEYNEFSNDEGSDGAYLNAKEYHSDEEGLLRGAADEDSEEETSDDESSDEEFAPKYEGRPFYFTCYCGKDHGFVPEGEEIKWDSDDDLGDYLPTAGEEELRDMIARRGEGVSLQCDECAEIQELNCAGDFDNPRLQELYALQQAFRAAREDNVDSDEWREFVEELDDGLTISDPEQMSEEFQSSRSLSPVMEEDEN